MFSLSTMYLKENIVFLDRNVTKFQQKLQKNMNTEINKKHEYRGDPKKYVPHFHVSAAQGTTLNLQKRRNNLAKPGVFRRKHGFANTVTLAIIAYKLKGIREQLQQWRAMNKRHSGNKK